jgi:hypothetical protein
MTEWWQGLAPAQAEVDCGGSRHRLRWENGILDALDHGDVESERTLAALGGQSCTCLDLVETWDRHRENLRVLVLGSRGPTDTLSAPPDDRLQAAVRRRRIRAARGSSAGSGRASVRAVHGPMVAGPRKSSGATANAFVQQPVGRVSDEDQAENELLALLALGGKLPDRLVATVAAAWKQRLQEGGRRPAGSSAYLQAALYGRVVASIRGWLGASAPKSEVVMVSEQREPKLIAKDDCVRVELPFSWLVDVWAQGLATIWDRFCLAARTDDGCTWRLTTVGTDLGSPSVLTLQLGT